MATRTTRPTPDARSQAAPLWFPLRWMLRRVARMALISGLSYRNVETLLKQSFLQSAADDFPTHAARSTDSRLSLLTGLHRHDIRRLRSASEDAAAPPMSLAWRVAERWSSAPFVDSRGRYAALPRLASVGGEQSFEGLVRSVSTDIRAPALLSEWLEQGVVSVSADDSICFNSSRFFNRTREREEMMNLTAMVCGDLLQGQLDVVTAPERGNHRLRYFWLSGLTEASVAELRKATDELLETGQRVYALGLKLERQDAGRPGATHRFLMAAFRHDAQASADPLYPAFAPDPPK